MALVRRTPVTRETDSSGSTSSGGSAQQAAEQTAEQTAEKLRALHEARVRAELAAADVLAPGSDRVSPRGALMAQVVAVKGLPGPAEATGGAAMSGADGTALAKALEALGWDPRGVFYTLSRPEPAIEPARRAERLRVQIESVDPAAVVALDPEAAEDLVEAFGCEPLRPGATPLRVLGRHLVAVDGFEAALADPKAKQRVWAQLKSLKPEGPSY
jgi:hypothetical protein